MALKHTLGPLVHWHMLLFLQNSATPPPHQCMALNCHRRPQLPRLGSRAPLRCRPPLSPLLSSPFPANPRLALKPQMQKLIACVKQFWHELVLKKPNFCWSSAPVSFCSPNDHFGPFSCPIKKNTKFVPKPPSFRRMPNSLQISSKLTP